jgi:branched-subunit amino acid transport protein
MTAWVMVAAVGVATLILKAVGPILRGGKPLPDRVAGVVTLLGPALLSALVAIGTFGDGRSLVLDARVPGVLAAVVAIRLRAPVLLVVIAAAAVTATIRAVHG